MKPRKFFWRIDAPVSTCRTICCLRIKTDRALFTTDSLRFLFFFMNRLSSTAKIIFVYCIIQSVRSRNSRSCNFFAPDSNCPVCVSRVTLHLDFPIVNSALFRFFRAFLGKRFREYVLRTVENIKRLFADRCCATLAPFTVHLTFASFQTKGSRGKRY